MRQARLLLGAGEGDAYYHCMSRAVDRRFIFGDEEKTYFYEWMRRLERFSSVEVVTWCLMSNHFHLLLRVPDKERLGRLSLEELKEELRRLYGKEGAGDVLQELERAEAAGDVRWVEEIRERYEVRRGDLSKFMKELKQRFTMWYNRREGRRGTLWEDRFKSVLVEGSDKALMTMAAYIELNPVRAGLVEDPKDYRWCGYAEAVAGGALARKGLCRLLDQTSYGTNRMVNWKGVSRRYRRLLFEHGEERSYDEGDVREKRHGIIAEKVDEVIASGVWRRF
ncbi:MAG: transposase [Chthoniobacterales bacterium]